MSVGYKIAGYCLAIHGAVFVSHVAAQPLPSARIVWAEAQYRHEPSPTQLVAAALRTARLTPKYVNDVASRARMAGWIPRLSFGIRRGQTRDLSQLQATTNDRINRSTDDHLTMEALLVFDLDRLVFSGEETALLREERSRALERQELIQLVVDLYYERRRLQYERDLLGKHELEVHVRIAHIGALLNGLTGGEFYRRTYESRHHSHR